MYSHILLLLKYLILMSLFPTFLFQIFFLVLTKNSEELKYSIDIELSISLSFCLHIVSLFPLIFLSKLTKVLIKSKKFQWSGLIA